MRNGLQEFRPRQNLDRQLTATTLNKILRELESLRITQVVGGTFRKLPQGTEIIVPTQAPSAPLVHPFQIVSGQTAKDAPYKVVIRPGTLNNVVASNWDIETNVSEGQLRYVVLTVTATNNAVISTSLSFDSSPPTGEQSPQKWALPTEFKVLIGMVQPPKVFQIVTDNLSFNASKRITTDRSNPAIGQLPYDNWYVWQQQP